MYTFLTRIQIYQNLQKRNLKRKLQFLMKKNLYDFINSNWLFLPFLQHDIRKKKRHKQLHLLNACHLNQSLYRRDRSYNELWG